MTFAQVSAAEADGDDVGRVFSIGHFCGISAADAESVLIRGTASLATFDGGIGSAQPALKVNGAEIELPKGQVELLNAASELLRSRYISEPDVLGLLPDLFTLADLKDAHDAVIGGDVFSADAFRRVMEPQLLIVGERRTGSVGRPAKVYRRLGVVPTRPITSPVEGKEDTTPAGLSSNISDNAASAADARVIPQSKQSVSKSAAVVSTSAAYVEVQMRNGVQRRWLDQLLSYASASLTVTEDPQESSMFRFTAAPDRTHERAIEQVLALVDKCHESFPQSFVDIHARRGTHRQRRADLRTTNLYLPYVQGLRQRLNEIHDLGSVARVLIDIACASPDQLLRFNVNEILREAQALELMLDATAATGIVVHDVPDESGALPTAAEMDIRSRMPVLLNMVGAEAMAFRTISDRLGLLAEATRSEVTRVTERIWFVAPSWA
ncbi:MAG: hypothetical protein RL745_951 [Actinomycetota bacterium]